MANGVLLTNDDTLSIQDAALAYKGLRVIERRFRSLKRGQIYLGPMYHRTPKRIEAYVKICVLALLIQRVVELTVGESWFQLRQCLNGLQAIELRTTTHQFFQRNEPSQELRDVFKKLDISMPKPDADTLPVATVCVRDIYEAVLRKLRVQGEAHQVAFTA